MASPSRIPVEVPADGAFEQVNIRGAVVFIEESPDNTPEGVPTFHLDRGGDGFPCYSRSALAWLPGFRHFYIRGTAAAAGSTLYLLIFDDPCGEGVYGSGAVIGPNPCGDCEDPPNTFPVTESLAIVYTIEDNGLFRRDLETWDNKTAIDISLPYDGAYAVAGWDETGDHIYALQGAPTNLYQVDADSGTPTSVAVTTRMAGAILDTVGRRVFWGNGASSSGAGCKVHVYDIAADTTSLVHDFATDRYAFVTYDPLLDKLYVMTTDLSGTGASSLYRMNPDGTQVENLKNWAARENGNLAVHPNLGFIAYIDTSAGVVRKLSLADLSSDAAIASAPNSSGWTTSTNIRIDFAAAKIYWSNNVDQNVRRANFDGTDEEIIFSETVADIYGISLIAKEF